MNDYAPLLVPMRPMGKRVAAQLSITNSGSFLCSAPRSGTDPGVGARRVPSAVLLLVVVTMQRLTLKTGLQWQRVEVLQHSDVTGPAKDGRMHALCIQAMCDVAGDASVRLARGTDRASRVVAPYITGITGDVGPAPHHVAQARAPWPDRQARYGAGTARRNLPPTANLFAGPAA